MMSLLIKEFSVFFILVQEFRLLLRRKFLKIDFLVFWERDLKKDNF